MAAGRASNLQLAPPQTAAALVLDGDASLRRDTAILLRGSGFEPITDDGPGETREAGVAILLAVGERNPVPRMRETVERLAGRPVVLVAASDFGGRALRQALQAGAAGIVEAGRLRETLMPTLEAVLPRAGDPGGRGPGLHEPADRPRALRRGVHRQDAPVVGLHQARDAVSGGGRRPAHGPRRGVRLRTAGGSRTGRSGRRAS